MHLPGQTLHACITSAIYAGDTDHGQENIPRLGRPRYWHTPMRHPWHLDVDGNGKPSHKLCKHLPQMQTWRAYRFGHGSLARTRFWRLDFIRRTRRTSPGRHFEIYVDNPSQVPVSRQVSPIQSNPIGAQPPNRGPFFSNFLLRSEGISSPTWPSNLFFAAPSRATPAGSPAWLPPWRSEQRRNLNGLQRAQD